MEIRNLGKSGLRVSAIGLGCNNLGGRIDLQTSRQVVHQALECGINFFDVADVYGRREAHYGASEEALGTILESMRNNVIIATKFGLPMDKEGIKQGASRRYIRQAVEASLRRLKTDYIDLYQLHMPDPLTPIEETLRALDDLVREGKVLYTGCSNLPAWQIADAAHLSQRHHLNAFISCQDEYSLLVRRAKTELFPAIRHFGLGFLPYFPLASGLLTGKYKRGAPLPENSRLTAWTYLADQYLNDRNWKIIESLEGFAHKRKRTLVEIAFGWLLSHSEVSSVIAGATSPEQVRSNVKAALQPLTKDEITEITALVDS